MNISDLSNICLKCTANEFKRSGYYRTEDCALLLNFNDFKKLEHDLHAPILSYGAAEHKGHSFKFNGVLVSWSPTVEKDCYIFGKTATYP